MKIGILIDNDYVFHPDFLDTLVESLQGGNHSLLVGIVDSITPAPRWKDRFSDFNKKITFIGGLPGLCRLSSRLFRKRARQLLDRKASLSVRQVCRRHRVPCFFTTEVNSPETEARLKSFSPDLLFSSQGQVLKESILQIPRWGCVNKHSGLLPRYRGVWPVFWTLLHGERECGVSIHLMNTRIDDGSILYQIKFPIEESDSVYTLYEKIFYHLPGLFLKLLAEIENNLTVPRPNLKEESSYFSFPTRESVRQLRQLNKRVI